MLKKIALSVVLMIVLLSGVAYWLTLPSTPPERQVFINGQVLTMDSENSIAEAVAVEGERIVAVGSRADIEPFMEGALVHDLQGKTLLPGFIDAHSHFPFSGLRVITADLNSPPIGNINSIADIQAALAVEVSKKEPGKFIFALGYDDTLLAEKRHPTREELDAVSTEHPIYALHVSGHMGVANSPALALAGIGRDTPSPEGGVIVKDPQTGEPTGLLEETAANALNAKALDFSLSDLRAIMDDGIAHYASVGVTTAQSGGLDAAQLNALSMAAKFNYIPQRLELWPHAKYVGKQLATGEMSLEKFNSDKVRARIVKITADGSIQGFTGFLGHPYHTPFRGDADYRGYPIYPREELTKLIADLHKAGFQMAVHANGDAAIDDVIYAFDQAQQAHPVPDPRLILIHAQMSREDQLVEMKRLGITPSFFSAHTYYWGDRHRDIFMGPERAMQISPTQSAEQLGLPYTVHLDTPVVPMQPMQLLWSTVNRLSSSGEVIGEGQRVTPMQALRAMTINAAWQIFREDELGSIEPGKLADLVVLDGDPLSEPLDVRDIQVEQTLVGGVSIYQR